MQKAERKLYAAVLMQAVCDLTQRKVFPDQPGAIEERSPGADRARRLAIEWILDDADYPFSFQNCCRVLGLNARSGRRSLMRLAGLDLDQELGASDGFTEAVA